MNLPLTVSWLEAICFLAGLGALMVTITSTLDLRRTWRLASMVTNGRTAAQLRLVARVNLVVEILRLLAIGGLAFNAGLALLTYSRTDVVVWGSNISELWTLSIQVARLLAIVTLTVGSLVLRWQRQQLLLDGIE